MPTVIPAAGPALEPWAVLLLVLATAVPVLLGTRPVLRRLPEPPEPEGKAPYAGLATHRFVAVCTVLAGLCALLVAVTLPRSTWPLWWVLCAPALVLAAIDARTTWLPLSLTRLTWAAMAGAAVVATVLGGPGLLVRSVVGAAAAALLYLALWRVSGRQLGFGDVRFAPLLGAAAAAVDWSMLLTTLLLGSLVGALVGVVVAIRRPGTAFAYAPSMLAGAFLACGVLRLSA